MGKARGLSVATATSVESLRAAAAASDAATVLGALRERYWALAESGPRRDPGAHLRRALVELLDEHGEGRPEIYHHALRTQERMPPESTEVCAPLRAAALIALMHSDEALAGYEAARLLGDADKMTGEPALTAVRVLAALGDTRLLYASAVAANSPPEVRGECLAALSELPGKLAQELLADLVDPRQPPAAAPVVAGATDLVLAHGERPSLWPLLQRLLAETRELDAFRYAATAIVARRDAALLETLRSDPGVRRDPRKLRLVEEAATLL